MVLALTILLYMDNKSMENWKLRLQPNTVVALLATLTRATLIFPLAECLGHLKWTFFEQPRTLDFMNTFDVASRGPLGASKFLWHANIKSPLSSCAALITILLLLFQPFMQQTIEVAARSAPMSNETAYATRATSYEDLEENCKCDTKTPLNVYQHQFRKSSDLHFSLAHVVISSFQGRHRRC